MAATRTLFDSYEFARGANVRANDSISVSKAPEATGIRVQVMLAAAEGRNNAKYRGVRVGYADRSFAIDAAQAKFYDSTISDLVSYNLGVALAFNAFTVMGIVDFTKAGSGAKSATFQHGGSLHRGCG